MTAVSVTAEHILIGDRQDCESCPVALAIAQAFPDLTYVSVDTDIISVQAVEGGRTYLDVPCEVVDFVLDFDAGCDVEPFTFELDYPAATP